MFEKYSIKILIMFTLNIVYLYKIWYNRNVGGRRMKIIGVTGSSGAGKDTLCEILENKYNAEIVDADKIARELSKKGTMYLQSIVESFGSGIVDRKGELNRKKLASIIYEDDKKREELNKLTFIYVVDEIKKRINKIKKKIIVVNAPLLFESNLDQVCDFVIAIIAERKVQIERIMKRDNIQEDEAEKRLNMQNTDDFYIENADYIIHNKGDIKDIEKQLKDIKI